MGIGTLGFLKGASKVALDSIDAREEAERELKKQQQLENFRADLRQKQEMATATTWLREDRADGKSYLVGLNSQGQRVPGAEREEAADEAAARKYKGTLDTLTIKDKEQNIEKGGVDIENTRDTIRSRREDDRRAAELARAQAGYYNRGNQPSPNRNSGGGLDTINLSDAPQLALSRAAEEVITVDPGISRLLGDYAIPANLVEVIKKDAIGQALRDPNAKSPAARAQLASTIMRRVILETGDRYPKENK
jgi:hypothetical protein